MHLSELNSISNSNNGQQAVSRNVKIRIKEKIDYFFDNIYKVFLKIGDDLLQIINKYKNEASSFEDIENVIAKMWTNENFNLFHVWNKAIIADLYFVAVSDDSQHPRFLEGVNIDLSKDTLEEKLDILWYYWSWLWFMSYKYGGARNESYHLYRGLSLWTDNQYKIGSNYRFISFQNCSTDPNFITTYMSGESNVVFEIDVPEHWKNGFFLKRRGEENIRRREFLIVPFTRFTMNSNIFS